MSEPLTGWNRAPIPVPALTTAALLPLFEVNETALTLLAAHAQRTPYPAAKHIDLVNGLRGRWRTLDAASIRRAAQCPVLLVDFDLHALTRKESPLAPEVEWCPRAKAVPLMRSALTLTWHLCRMDRQTACIRLGLPPTAVQVLQNLRLQQIARLAESKFHLLRPRWEHRQDFWKNLLLASHLECEDTLSEAKLQALHLLVSELSSQPPAHPARMPADIRGHNARNPTDAPASAVKPA